MTDALRGFGFSLLGFRHLQRNKHSWPCEMLTSKSRVFYLSVIPCSERRPWTQPAERAKRVLDAHLWFCGPRESRLRGLALDLADEDASVAIRSSPSRSGGHGCIFFHKTWIWYEVYFMLGWIRPKPRSVPEWNVFVEALEVVCYVLTHIAP